MFEVLKELHGQHPTAEEVYQRLKPINQGISLGTVHKTLDAFAEKGLVQRVFSEEAGKRYDANNHTHSHIYCSNTKEMMDYEDEELQSLLAGFFRKRNMGDFEIKRIPVQLTGIKMEPEKRIKHYPIN